MTHIHVTVNGTKQPIRMFRSDNGFESVEDYLLSTIFPFCVEHCDEMFAIRCSITGWRVGNYDSSEVLIALRQGMVATGFTRFDNILFTFTRKDLIEAIETLIDHVSIRTLILARPSPIFTGAVGAAAVSTVPRNRQLITLLNVLLFDNGQLRGRHNDSVDTINRLRKAAALADRIALEWNGEYDSEAENANGFQDLYSGLVELDAKWQLTKLKLREHEQKQLDAIRDADTFNLDKVRKFVWQLILYHEQQVELDLASGWTRDEYREIVMGGFNMAESRAPSSNVLNPAKPSEINAAKGIKPSKPSKSKNPKVAMFADIFDNIFGS